MLSAARFASLAGSCLLVGFAVSAQTNTAQVSPPPFGCTTTVGPLRGFVTSGPTAPYSAVQEFSHTQTLADGTVISSNRAGTEKVYRDSQGRVRTEHSFCQRRGDAEGGTWVEIRDPVGGYAYILDPATHAAHRYTIKVRQSGGSTPTTAQVVSAPPSSAAPAQSGIDRESLGSQTMEGVPVDGVRITTVVPVGQMDNDRPFKIVSESWTSPLLGVNILSKYIDPRMGESTTRLTNIELTEPDPALFQIPPDYTVSDDDGPVKLTYQRPSTP
jgi:hypothetical protein